MGFFFHQWQQCVDNSYAPQPLQIWGNLSLIYKARETTKQQWVMGVFRDLSVFLSAKGVKMKALSWCVRVIANRPDTKDVSPGSGERMTNRKVLEMTCFFSFFFWKRLPLYEVKGLRNDPQQMLDYPRGTGGRGLTINADSIWLITSRLIWILLAHKNTFYSLHMSRSRRVKASICMH